MRRIVLFDNQTEDGESPKFRPQLSITSGLMATLPILLVRGNLGGGSLSLKVQDSSDTFRELFTVSLELNNTFPSDTSKMEEFVFRSTSAYIYRIDLEGSTNPSIYIEASSCDIIV